MNLFQIMMLIKNIILVIFFQKIHFVNIMLILINVIVTIKKMILDIYLILQKVVVKMNVLKEQNLNV